MRQPTSLQRIAPLALGLQLLATGALAQYRPPPQSDAERFISDGDDARTASAKASSMGEKQEAVEKLKEAVDAYEKALVADPKAVTAAIGLGAAASSLKDWAKVIKVLGPMHEIYPKDIDLRYYLAVAQLKTKNYAEADRLLEPVGKAGRADLFIAHYYLGWLALQRQDGDRTVVELTRYLQERPTQVAANDFEIHELKGRGYLLLRSAALARAAFEEAGKGRPESVPVQMGLIGVLELEEKRAEAMKRLEGLVQRFPKAPEPKEKLGRLYLTTGEVKKAEGMAQELLKIQGNSAQAHLLMADVKMAQKQYPAAELALKQALKLSPGMPSAQISLANAMQQQGRNDEAIVLLDEAAGERPNIVEFQAALGTVYRRAARYQKAIATHQNVVRLLPASPRGHLLLGADQFAIGQWDQAIEEYSTAMERDPGHKGARHWLSLALSRRARVRIDNGLLDDASRDLRRALDLEPTAATARSLGALLLTQQRWVDAKAVLAQATKLPGSNWRDPFLMGYALMGSEDAKGALASFEDAAKLAKEPEAQGQIYAGWALAKLDLGEFDTAVSRLTETGGAAARVASTNLPLALLRRSAGRLRDGDISGATKDLEQANQLQRTPEIEKLSELVKALLLVEQGRFDPAQTALKKALPPGDKGAEAAGSRAFLEAYLDYRRGRPLEARKKLAVALKAAKGGDGYPDFARANSRRDGEMAYLQGAMPRAERALKEAQGSDPLNPYVLHNLACVQYRKGGAKQAVSTWEGVIGSVPEASLNLGIVAQVDRKEMRRAVEYYARYLRTRGSHTGLAREWKERIEAIYGVSDGGGDAEKEETP